MSKQNNRVQLASTHQTKAPSKIENITNHRYGSNQKRVGFGVIIGWVQNTESPLAIRMDSGNCFLCGGIKDKVRLSSIASRSIGEKVSFFHDDLDINGNPVNPLFKTLLLDGKSHD